MTSRPVWPRMSASAGRKEANGLYVDGVDTAAVPLGTAYLHFNQNWLQEVEIVALGAGPEDRRIHRRLCECRVPLGGQRLVGIVRGADHLSSVARPEHGGPI